MKRKACLSVRDFMQVAGQPGQATSTHHKQAQGLPVHLPSAALSASSTKAQRTVRDSGAA
jgi:hypothetical protein